MMKIIATLLSVLVLAPMNPKDADEIVLEGIMKPWRTVAVRSAVDGLLEDVLISRGDYVKENDIVALLKFAVEKSDLDIARAKAKNKTDLELARTELEFKTKLEQTNRSLMTKGIIDREQFLAFENDRALAALKVRQEEASLRQALLECKRAQARYDRREIRAPIDGLVIQKLSSKGEMVSRSADKPILEIAEMKRLAVDVHAPIALIHDVKVGMKVFVVAEALGGRRIPAKVKIADRVADAASGTFGVRIQVDNPNCSLPAGLKCRVYFQAQD